MVFRMYLTEKEIQKITMNCLNDNTLDIVSEIEKADFAAFTRTTHGTKGDYYHKKILTRIKDEGYLDVNPRPHYEDEVLVDARTVTDLQGNVIEVGPEQGIEKKNGKFYLHTPAHTISVNETMTRYDLQKGECPILTLRPIAWKSAVKEILWIYQMQSNKIGDLHNLGIKYWDDWDIGDNTIGQRYGYTVKKYDLLNSLLNGLKKDPYGRRHIIELWQVEDFKKPGLNPCCHLTTWNVRNDGKGNEFLDMEMKQRSSDFATSVSINELQYIALLLMVAKHCGYKPGVFTHVTTNVQIYDRHMEQADTLIDRNPVPTENCQLVLDTDKTDFYEFTIDDFKLINYPLNQIKETNPQLTFDLGI